MGYLHILIRQCLVCILVWDLGPVVSPAYLRRVIGRAPSSVPSSNGLAALGARIYWGRQIRLPRRRPTLRSQPNVRGSRPHTPDLIEHATSAVAPGGACPSRQPRPSSCPDCALSRRGGPTRARAQISPPPVPSAQFSEVHAALSPSRLRCQPAAHAESHGAGGSGASGSGASGSGGSGRRAVLERIDRAHARLQWPIVGRPYGGFSL